MTNKNMIVLWTVGTTVTQSISGPSAIICWVGGSSIEQKQRIFHQRQNRKVRVMPLLL